MNGHPAPGHARMTPKTTADGHAAMPRTVPADQANRRPHRRNRVSPFGKLEATSARGTLMGNRGDLHAADGTTARHHAGEAWICCTLTERNGRRVVFDRKGHYTPLFFHDEAVAFAAGHRPCAECRRADFLRFQTALQPGDGPPRRHVRSRPRDRHPPASGTPGRQGQALLPGRARRPAGRRFFTMDSASQAPLLLWQDKAHPWSHAGYGAPVTLPDRPG